VRLPPPPQPDVPQENLEPGDGGDSALAQVQDGQQDEGLKMFYHVLKSSPLTNRKVFLL
jgi:hypothetical protein